MANILILRSANTGDEDIKTGVAEVELENGFAVALGEVSTERKTRNAYKVDAATADTDIIGLVYNADVPFLTDEMGNVYKGVVSDPRNIKFPAGTPVNIWIPGKNAEIAMTKVAGTADGATHVVYKANDMKPTYATDTTDALLAFKITGSKYVSIGADRVPTVEMIKVKVSGTTETDVQG